MFKTIQYKNTTTETISSIIVNLHNNLKTELTNYRVISINNLGIPNRYTLNGPPYTYGTITNTSIAYSRITPAVNAPGSLYLYIGYIDTGTNNVIIQVHAFNSNGFAYYTNLANEVVGIQLTNTIYFKVLRK